MYVVGRLRQRTTEATTGRDVIHIAHSSCSKENKKVEGIVLGFREIPSFLNQIKATKPQNYACGNRVPSLCTRRIVNTQKKKEHFKPVKSIFDGIAQTCLVRQKLRSVIKKRFSWSVLCLPVSLCLSVAYWHVDYQAHFVRIAKCLKS